MRASRLTAPLLGLLALAAAAASAQEVSPQPIETPGLAPRVAKGELPPVAQRLPATPAVVDLERPGVAPGRHGGEIRLLMSRAKDVRMMVVYGYARLAAWTPDFRLVPDIAQRIEVREGRIFTIVLREGHRWSDGEPFTSEDFRYWWEDVAGNRELSPMGAPPEMLVEGHAPRFEVIDERTVRYSWDRPNPDFLPALAGAAPLIIYSPSHYLRRFHIRYSDPDRLAERVALANQRNWAALHNRRDNQYQNENPDLPTLQPWMVQTRPPSQRFLFTRNPYFHRVDRRGRQLPYIDRVIMNIADPKILPAKTGAGEADLQARGIHFGDYTFLKRGEKSHGYRVKLWRTAKGSQVALFPNLNIADETWRSVFRDVRFRRALSLAINRREVNQVVYFGLATEGANTVLSGSPLYRDDYRTAWAGFDLKRADALLDEMGLTRRDSRGIRLLPDGRPMEIIVETAGEDTEQTDVLELVHDSWQKIGIRLHTRPSQRELFRNRVFSGDAMMSVWTGLENGVPTAMMSPGELAPTSQQQLQWPKWGQHFESGGKVGEPPADARAAELLALYRDWRYATDPAERARIWHRMLALNVEQVYSIGIVAGVPQPVVAARNLRNLPDEGIYNWDPGAFFGIYRPDTFWLDDVPQTAAGTQR